MFVLSNPFTESVTALIKAQLAGNPQASAAVSESQVVRPPDSALGDYAFPCFGLAKLLRQAPPVIAKEIAAGLASRVAATPLLTSVEAVGAYVNFRVAMEEMAALTIPAILDGSYFRRNAEASRAAGKAGCAPVMVEYSQPNTHKAFHVGHMRNVALGDALVRLLRYNGNKVIAANYIGDVGTHIAKCLWYVNRHHGGELPRAECTPDRIEERGEWLGEQYTAATRALEDAPPEQKSQFEQEVSQVLQQLEARSIEISVLWEETRQWSLESFDEIYRWLGAHFEHVFYESEMDGPGKVIVEEGLERGVFIHSRGAIGIDLESEHLGFLLLLKGDGTTLYATKDLALARIKFEQFQIGRSIHVVGAEQTLHFQQVFKTLEKLGYSQVTHSVHLAYGLVMLPDGKMSSRAGNVILFSQLRDEMRGYIREHYLNAHLAPTKAKSETNGWNSDQSWSEEEVEETARRIAVAAIRYGMVKQDPGKTIIFNMEDWLQAEGDTGTYLCYAHTRIRSVERQVGLAPRADADFSLLTQIHEQVLIRELQDFNRVVLHAEQTLRPNMIAGALFQLCKAFSRAYARSPVKQAETASLRDARLALFAATGRVLREGLGLLGIMPPERM